MPPVPRLQRAVKALSARGGQQARALGRGLALGRLPHLRQQPLHGVWSFGHGVGQLELGEAGIAQQAGALGAQGEDLGHQHPVVMLAGMAAPRDPGLVGDPAQVPAGGEGQERLDQGARQGDRVADEAAFGGCLGRAVPHEGRQPIQVGLSQLQVPRLLVVQHVLPEGGVQHGQPLGYGRHPCFGCRVQGRAAADEAEVGALQKAPLVLGQPERIASLVQGIDAGEHCRVERDLHGVLGELGRHLAVQRLQRRAAQADDQVGEHGAHAVQGLAGPLQRLDCVGEAGRRRVSADRGDLGQVGRHAVGEGRGEVLRPDQVEGRHAERGRPGCQQRVGIGHWRMTVQKRLPSQPAKGACPLMVCQASFMTA